MSELEKPATRAFVNVYQDDDGRFISNIDHPTFDAAIWAVGPYDRDQYVETVEIIRPTKRSNPKIYNNWKSHANWS